MNEFLQSIFFAGLVILVIVSIYVSAQETK